MNLNKILNEEFPKNFLGMWGNEMPSSSDTKVKVAAFFDWIAGYALTISIIAAAISITFLLIIAFGQTIKNFGALSATDQTTLINTVASLTAILNTSIIVLVLSLMIKAFMSETLGHALLIFGVLIYFLSPSFLAKFSAEEIRETSIFLEIAKTFQKMGLVMLFPGLVLVIRDSIITIWTGVSVNRLMKKRMEETRGKIRQTIKSKFLSACWEMAYCREYIRKYCPAFIEKKSCWKIKKGCFCDEKTILNAMSAKTTDNEIFNRMKKEMLDDYKVKQSLTSAKTKRERCRRCVIYAERQRQKYKLISPLVFPTVALFIYLSYDNLSSIIMSLLTKADDFMRLVLYQTNDTAYFTSDGSVIVFIAIAWLSLMALTYALKAVEYFIFELQV
ncbi:MAG: hypothetical protein SNJ70_05345 [Armatimonadota bacterium]